MRLADPSLLLQVIERQPALRHHHDGQGLD
jgi:hypothetical protein